MPPPRHRGYTLPELLVTLGIASILAAFVLPSFAALGDTWALRTAAGSVLSGLAEARLAALARGEEVRLCPSGRVRCEARGSGYLVVADDGAATLRAGILPSRIELSANRPAARYYPWPRSASPVTLVLCALPARRRSLAVIVSQGGRPRVEPAGAC